MIHKEKKKKDFYYNVRIRHKRGCTEDNEAAVEREVKVWVHRRKQVVCLSDVSAGPREH